MKTSISLLIVGAVIISNSAASQKITLTDLLKVNKENYSQFDSYATSHGFIFQEKKGDDSLKQYVYRTKDDKETLYRYDDSSSTYTATAYDTENEKAYLILKNELKSLGFKFIKNDTYQDALRMFYRKRNDKVVIIISKISSSGTEKRNSYSFHVN